MSKFKEGYALTLNPKSGQISSDLLGDYTVILCYDCVCNVIKTIPRPGVIDFTLRTDEVECKGVDGKGCPHE